MIGVATLPSLRQSTNNPDARNGSFDPFRDLLASHASRPAHLYPVNMRTLTPFQRALLAIDGTVTKFIEAYHLEPVEIVLLKQDNQLLTTDHHWLDTPAGTDVIARQVLLRGRYTDTIYAYAISLLAPTRLPSTFLQYLDTEPGGLGRMLLNSQIENRRELLWYGREHLTDMPDELLSRLGAHCVSRTYRIIAGGKPLMLITEKFPTLSEDRAARD